MAELASREHLTWLCDDLQRRLDIADAEARAAESAVKIADELLVQRAALIEELRGAIQWMSGSADFAPGGSAHEGWLKVRHLALLDARPSETDDRVWMLDRIIHDMATHEGLRPRLDDLRAARDELKAVELPKGYPQDCCGAHKQYSEHCAECRYVRAIEAMLAPSRPEAPRDPEER